jgi:hypothetical protein
MHIILTIIVVLAALPGMADAGGYTHGSGDGSCRFVPTTGVEGQPFQVFATGLPVNRTVSLIVTNYEWPTHSFPVTVSPDGTYSETFTIPADGHVTFSFASPSTNSTRLWDLDAKCVIKLAPE